MANLLGKNTVVEINGSTICTKTWSVDTSYNEADATTSCSGGYTESDVTTESATFTISGIFTDTNYYGAGTLAAISGGGNVTVSDVKFYHSSGGTVQAHFPSAKVSVSLNNTIEGHLEFTINGVNNGEFSVTGEVA